MHFVQISLSVDSTSLEQLLRYSAGQTMFVQIDRAVRSRIEELRVSSGSVTVDATTTTRHIGFNLFLVNSIYSVQGH